LIAETDRAGEYLFHLFHLHAFYLAYASHRVPEITETIYNVDNGQKWGFSHELGPFEIWDAIGVAESIPRFEAAGYPVADWVKRMVGNPATPTFYQRGANGIATGYYSPTDAAYLPLPVDPLAITVKGLRTGAKSNGVVAKNDSASLIDMGDGVALFEFHSQALAIDADLVEMGYKALELVDRDFDALVVGHDGERFWS